MKQVNCKLSFATKRTKGTTSIVKLGPDNNRCQNDRTLYRDPYIEHLSISSKYSQCFSTMADMMNVPGVDWVSIFHNSSPLDFLTKVLSDVLTFWFHTCSTLPHG